MSDEPPAGKLFLSGQRLSVLSDRIREEHRRFHVCGDGAPPAGEVEKDPWEAQNRTALIAQALGPEPPRRVALVCDAGLGKTTNMEWLRAHLSRRGSRPVPLLLRLDSGGDLDCLFMEKTEPDALLRHLAGQVQRAVGGVVERHLHALSRYRDQGRVPLLIDGLDHALSLGGVPEIISRLMNSRWRLCPLWVSGRPYAFGRAWDLFTDPAWRFFRVEPLQQDDIERYLSAQVEPDAATRSGVKWYAAVPDEGRELLAIPRFLDLVAGVLGREVSFAKAKGRDPRQAVEALDLRTRADVYRLAYFEPGEYVAPQDRLTERRALLNRRGLIAQGLDVFLTVGSRGKEKVKYLGLKEGVAADPTLYREQIQFVGALLGAIAFEMYAAPDAYPGGGRKLEPNTSGVPHDRMRGFREAVERRLRDAGQHPDTAVEHEFTLLGWMNNKTVDFLLFQELTDQGLVWHDRTVQAFFAAYWAMKFGSPEDRRLLQRWVVDEAGKRLDGFDEFWTFAAELPDGLVDRWGWLQVFRPCYEPPQQVKGPDEYVQWRRRMVYHSWTRMHKRASDTVGRWRASYLALAQGSANQRRIHREIAGGFRPIAAGVCPYGADPLDDPAWPGVERVVKDFRLHQWLVTNEMYEEFDPAHRKSRWHGKHPLAGKRKNGDDRCPVVFVTWYDAWCFAAWCGCRVPTELEWEHACRAGSAEGWCFGNDEANLVKYAWFRQIRLNSNVSTHPVGQRKANKNGLFDMYGNVWEWCDDRAESGASTRAVRGGCWDNYGWDCRSAYSDRYWPDKRSRYCGFRLAAVPASLEPGEQGRGA